MLVINDGGDQVAVYALDAACQVVDVHTVPVDPYDPEDMAVARRRHHLAGRHRGQQRQPRRPWRCTHCGPTDPPRCTGSAIPTAPHDTEALLLAPDGTPYLVTKEVLGASGVYRPAAALVGRRHGRTGEGGRGQLHADRNAGRAGRSGRAADGRPAARSLATGGTWPLRTYTDAYVWPLTGSDVPAALAGTPVRVPLPDSPQGEAISFTADNRQLVVASEGSPSDLTVVPVPRGGRCRGEAPRVRRPVPSLTDFTSSGLSPITTGLIAAAVATLVVWLGGKFRRKPPGTATAPPVGAGSVRPGAAR